MSTTNPPILLKIADDFSKTPGARDRKTSKFSGEEFFEKVLEPKYLAARETGTSLIIDLDGTAGYPSSFLAYAFGKLELDYPGARQFIMFISLEEPYLVNDIREIFDEVYEE